jgi:hypothetical protein
MPQRTLVMGYLNATQPERAVVYQLVEVNAETDANIHGSVD